MKIPSDDNGYGDGLKTPDIRVTMDGTAFCSTHIGIIPEGQTGLENGQQLPGPWGFTVQHALVIDNYGGSARRTAELDLEVELGEPFYVEGLPGVWCFRRRNAGGPACGHWLEGDDHCVHLAPLDDAAQAHAIV